MSLHRFLFVAMLLLLSPVAIVSAAENVASLLPRAHAHNDYLHPRPLLDALSHGFNSVEADIYLVDDQLLVAHWYHEISPYRTLEKLYLDPLKERVEAGDGHVYPNAPPLRLLIDLKSDGEKTYAALDKVLAKYADMLCRVEDGKYYPGAVEVVISGNRPKQMLAEQKLRYAGLDGRLGDLGGKTPKHLMPLVSDNWKSHFKWKGAGEIPAAEKEKLQRLVDQTHAEGREIRFWGSPDTPAMWRVLDECGVDAINTDKLSGLAEYLNDEQKSQQN
ncbi:phosphatidylinositol-specific phospholipase C/glycerophosphodiester phosphodiesterase family protein [Blastopirellula retiformator]|uniref:Altered inheritance of mitochondria protein 6 n=1 Tax=Blastopirellula retiformator TaxID=2527970 RepID=A0A5C5V1Z9_9BACT|nr:phosphatidylinositol-specific phospholipase C/glycerophosphodiester phosphodiesterase family protein [Blastopirellula retiformator]TWT31732.1 hypothetical protein Enr8_36560 [Blastopirellula retiformator]